MERKEVYHLTSFQTLLYKNFGTTRVELSNLARTTALQTCCQTEQFLDGRY